MNDKQCLDAQGDVTPSLRVAATLTERVDDDHYSVLGQGLIPRARGLYLACIYGDQSITRCCALIRGSRAVQQSEMAVPRNAGAVVSVTVAQPRPQRKVVVLCFRCSACNYMHHQVQFEVDLDSSSAGPAAQGESVVNLFFFF